MKQPFIIRPEKPDAGITKNSLVLRFRYLCFLTIGLATTATGGPKINKQEAILDRLEKKLLDYDQESLSISEKSLSSKKSGPSDSSIDSGQTSIAASSPAASTSTLDDLEKVVKEIEDQIDQTEDEVQRIRSELNQMALQGGYVELQLENQLSENAVISQIAVRLDGFEIYRVDTTHNYWIPYRIIPVYTGPMPAGDHRLDLEAVITKKSEQNSPIQGTGTTLENRSFSFKMQDGQQHRKWTITLKGSTKPNEQPLLETSDQEIKRGA
jgi:TolA-binding protein